MAKSEKELDQETIKLLAWMHAEGLNCAEATGVMVGAITIFLNQLPRADRKEAMELCIKILKEGVFVPLTVASSK